MTNEKTNLEHERLRSEIEFFQSVTKAISRKDEPAPDGPKKKGLSLAIIGTLITVLTGGFALYTKVDDFLNQRMKAYSVTYTNQMIDFVNKLKEDKDWESDQAILLLSSYEMDAVPILLFNLENEPPNRKEVYLRSLKMIKNKETVDDVLLIEKIIQSSKEYLLSKFEKVFTNPEEQAQKIHALRNYIFILSELGVGHEQVVKEHLLWIKGQLQNDTLSEEERRRLVIELNREIGKLGT